MTTAITQYEQRSAYVEGKPSAETFLIAGNCFLNSALRTSSLAMAYVDTLKAQIMYRHARACLEDIDGETREIIAGRIEEGTRGVNRLEEWLLYQLRKPTSRQSHRVQQLFMATTLVSYMRG
jgi:hypothetical protein